MSFINKLIYLWLGLQVNRAVPEFELEFWLV